MSRFDDFLKQVEAAKNYLLEVDVYDPTRGNTINFSDSNGSTMSVWQGTKTNNTTDVVGIWGDNDATRFVENTANQTHTLNASATLPTGVPTLVQVFYHLDGSRNNYRHYGRANGFSINWSIVYNIRTRARVSRSSTSDVEILADGCDVPGWLPAGWVRVWALIQNNSPSFTSFLLELQNQPGGSATYTGDGTSKFYLGGVFAEPNGDPTLKPLRKVAGVVETPLRTLTFSTQGFVTSSTDEMPNKVYEARIKTPLIATRSMFSGNATTTRSVPQYGDLQLENVDGGLDGLAAYSWDGRNVRVYLGGDGFARNDYGLIFRGKCLSMTIGRKVATLRLRDVQEELNTPIQPNRYAGTGGNEGPSNLKDAVKPLCFGRVYNVTPVVVNPATLKFQVHDGRINGVLAVYDNGATIPPANYTVDAANGYFTLTNTPVGQVTADVEGFHNGTAWLSNSADIIKEIAGRCGVLASEIDATAFSNLATLCPQVVGVYLRDETNALDVLDVLARSIGAFYGTDRQGLLTCGRLDLPTVGDTSVATFDESNILRDQLEPLEKAAFVKKLIVNYRKNWTQQNGDSLAGIVSTDPNAYTFKTSASLTASVTDNSVLTAHPYAEDLTFETVLTEASDALAEATRLMAMYGVPPTMYKVTTKAQPYALSVNNVVTLLHSRFGLSAGRKMRVLAIGERSSRNEIELTLWG